jgi:hypothetical protein
MVKRKYSALLVTSNDATFRSLYQPPFRPSSTHWNLIQSIKTMNWTKFRPSPNLTHEQIAILTTPGPNEHPHSALLPQEFRFHLIR